MKKSEIKKLSQEEVDRRYTKLLQKYNLKKEDIKLKSIEVKKGEKIYLTSVPTKEQEGNTLTGVYKTLRTRDFDELKSWIGIPDERAKFRKKSKFKPLSSGYTVKKLDDKLSDPDQIRKLKKDLKPIGKEYLYGVAEYLSKYKQLLEGLYDYITIGVANVGDIVIESGSEFIIERDIKILNAGNIQIHRGGKMIIDGGDLTLNAVSVEIIE